MFGNALQDKNKDIDITKKLSYCWQEEKSMKPTKFIRILIIGVILSVALLTSQICAETKKSEESKEADREWMYNTFFKPKPHTPQTEPLRAYTTEQQRLMDAREQFKHSKLENAKKGLGLLGIAFLIALLINLL